MTATASDSAPVCDPNDIAEVAVSIALAELGVHEVGGNNRGPRVEEYQKRVGGQPGEAWCAAFAYWSFDEAALRLGVANPCPRFRGALKMWTEADAVCHTPTPARGRLCILDHGHGLGHVSIVETVNDDGTITDVSGNTNEQGSRAGNAVARHTWNPANALAERRAKLVGFVDLSKATTRPAV